MSCRSDTPTGAYQFAALDGRLPAVPLNQLSDGTPNFLAAADASKYSSQPIYALTEQGDRTVYALPTPGGQSCAWLAEGDSISGGGCIPSLSSTQVGETVVVEPGGAFVWAIAGNDVASVSIDSDGRSYSVPVQNNALVWAWPAGTQPDAHATLSVTSTDGTTEVKPLHVPGAS